MGGRDALDTSQRHHLTVPDPNGGVDVALERTRKVPTLRNAPQENPRGLERISLDVLFGPDDRLHSLSARQTATIGRHHHRTGHVVRALEQLEDVVGCEDGRRVDAHVYVERLGRGSVEALLDRWLLTHHHLVTLLGTLEHQVSPCHQKVVGVDGSVLGSRQDKTDAHFSIKLMSSLTRSGYFIAPNPDAKRELTVRPIENALGIRPPSFKVFRETTKHLCVPRFYGEEKFGPVQRDLRPEPHQVSLEFTGTLRAHQIEALERYKGSGVLSLDTGLGKTVCAIAIACRMKTRTMIIVHKEFLANQWIERIQQFCPGATIGRVQQDRCELDHPFVIAMIQTLCMRSHPTGTFDSIGLVIVDEAHHVGAPAFSQAMFTMCPKYTLGLTATPDRKDGLTRILYWFLGPSYFTFGRESSKNVVVYKTPYTCPEYHMTPPMSRIGKVCLPSMVNMLVENQERNQLLLDIVRDVSVSHHTLVLSDRRSHCEWIVKQVGPTAGLYMGGIKQTDLDVAAKCRVVVGTFSLAHEGLDIPTLSAIVLATPHSDVRQAVGRILRVDGPKRVYDIVDMWSVMNAMYRKRLKIYQDAGFKVDMEDDPPPVASAFQKGKCMISLENA